jgi:hypothetical protein
MNLESEDGERLFGLKHHAKVHSFRIATAIVAWILIVAIFYYRPDLLKWGLRSATHGIEAIGDALPYPGAIVRRLFCGSWAASSGCRSPPYSAAAGCLSSIAWRGGPGAALSRSCSLVARMSAAISGAGGDEVPDVAALVRLQAVNYRGARLARIRCKVRRCMFSRRAVSETLRLHIS